MSHPRVSRDDGLASEGRAPPERPGARRTPGWLREQRHRSRRLCHQILACSTPRTRAPPPTPGFLAAPTRHLLPHRSDSSKRRRPGWRLRRPTRGIAPEQTETAALTNDELRGRRDGPAGELLLQVGGVGKRKPMDRGPRGDDAGVKGHRKCRWIAIEKCRSATCLASSVGLGCCHARLGLVGPGLACDGALCERDDLSGASPAASAMSASGHPFVEGLPEHVADMRLCV
jgi:hypothetical protein